MAVTKETYSVAPTWTPAQLADIFRDAFIDAGLMVGWYDSFLSGSIENRVLAITYDNTKTYGTTYYWFQFATNPGVNLQMATGWNNVSHVPTGTQWLDYLNTATNTTGYHWSFMSCSNVTTVVLDRYTSSVPPDDSWFVMRCASTHLAFTISKASRAYHSWLNMDRGIIQGFTNVGMLFSAQQAFLQFRPGPGIRRELVRGCGLRGAVDTQSNYASVATSASNISYSVASHVSNSNSNWSQIRGPIMLPVGFSATNPAYPTDSSPVYHSIAHSPYTVQPLSSEFGITFHFATNGFSVGDTFVVTPGVEEWEVLSYGNASSAITEASPIFLARTV